jgi:uncharacterized membrane protein
MDIPAEKKINRKEKRIFMAYELGLILKALQAFLEVIAGVLFYAISTNSMTTFILTVAHGELAEMPNDFLSDFLIKSAGQLSIQGKFFIVFYLLSHGVIKLIIIGGLYFKKRWAYPAALIGLGGLILYQIYRLAISHSIFLLALTVMDVIILWLIWHEHRVQAAS